MPKVDASAQGIAIVTGGSRGIGRAIVERLVTVGLDVTFTYASRSDLADQVVAGLAGAAGQARAVRVDARDAHACRYFVEETIAEHGRIDLLVNNAAIVHDRLLALMTFEDWSAVIETSLNGLFGMTQPVARQMMHQRSGRIINLTSVSGLMGIAGQTNYAAAKAAIMGFSRTLAKELAGVGVAVNAVAPGYVDTDMLAGLSEATRKRALAEVPMHRFASAEEIAGVVSYLALEAPSYLTGQTLVIDGGLSS
jgi:3-oxoacyl-[acyl-carrier protein] reductase